MRLYWEGGPLIQYNWCPYKRRRDTDTHTEGGEPCGDGSRDWDCAATSQGKARIAGAKDSLP